MVGVPSDKDAIRLRASFHSWRRAMRQVLDEHPDNSTLEVALAAAEGITVQILPWRDGELITSPSRVQFSLTSANDLAQSIEVALAHARLNT